MRYSAGLHPRDVMSCVALAERHPKPSIADVKNRNQREHLPLRNLSQKVLEAARLPRRHKGA